MQDLRAAGVVAGSCSFQLPLSPLFSLLLQLLPLCCYTSFPHVFLSPRICLPAVFMLSLGLDHRFLGFFYQAIAYGRTCFNSACTHAVEDMTDSWSFRTSLALKARSTLMTKTAKVIAKASCRWRLRACECPPSAPSIPQAHCFFCKGQGSCLHFWPPWDAFSAN